MNFIATICFFTLYVVLAIAQGQRRGPQGNGFTGNGGGNQGGSNGGGGGQNFNRRRGGQNFGGGGQGQGGRMHHPKPPLYQKCRDGDINLENGLTDEQKSEGGCFMLLMGRLMTKPNPPQQGSVPDDADLVWALSNAGAAPDDLNQPKCCNLKCFRQEMIAARASGQEFNPEEDNTGGTICGGRVEPEYKGDIQQRMQKMKEAFCSDNNGGGNGQNGNGQNGNGPNGNGQNGNGPNGNGPNGQFRRNGFGPNGNGQNRQFRPNGNGQNGGNNPLGQGQNRANRNGFGNPGNGNGNGRPNNGFGGNGNNGNGGFPNGRSGQRRFNNNNG